jgi:hypothetical protein
MNLKELSLHKKATKRVTETNIMPPKKGNKVQNKKQDAKKIVADKTFGMKNVRILLIERGHKTNRILTHRPEKQIFKGPEACQRD